MMHRKNFHLRLAATLLGGVATLLAFPVAAQNLDAQQGTANPARAEEQIQLRQMDARVSPNVNVQGAPADNAPAGAEKITFVLNDLQVEGVTVYSETELRAAYADRLGQTITLADLYGIAAQLTARFRNDGYILTQVVVPPQTIDGGVARLQVVEGYIDRVSVALEPGARAEGARLCRADFDRTCAGCERP